MADEETTKKRTLMGVIGAIVLLIVAYLIYAAIFGGEGSGSGKTTLSAPVAKSETPPVEQPKENPRPLD